MTTEKFNNYDVFHAFLVEDADYEGLFEMPKVRTSRFIPDKVITFSKAMSKACTDFDSWVIFYEHDTKFERLWNNPKAYLKKLKKFKGVISPDFSLYRNMPLCMQIWNTYRNHALAAWLQNNGIEIIPNVRFNDERTYLFCFDGIEKNKTVAVGTHGCLKLKEDKAYFETGLAELVKRLSPKNIIVYGAAPNSIFKSYKGAGINIIRFESEFSKFRKQTSTEKTFTKSEILWKEEHPTEKLTSDNLSSLVSRKVVV
ncbi:MAG: DUF4417 domain-containing protein [Bacillota bacterium]|nr:DUF4417 domain-containing protein [Bacillota bacterium]